MFFFYLCVFTFFLLFCLVVGIWHVYCFHYILILSIILQSPMLALHEYVVFSVHIYLLIIIIITVKSVSSAHLHVQCSLFTCYNEIYIQLNQISFEYNKKPQPRSKKEECFLRTINDWWMVNLNFGCQYDRLLIETFWLIHASRKTGPNSKFNIFIFTFFNI